MGIGIIIELGHGTDERLRRALRPLAAFGLIHGMHEWSEMFLILYETYLGGKTSNLWEGVDLGVLAFSFLSLAAFGSFLLTQSESRQRYSLLIPLIMATVWAFGLLILRGIFPPEEIYNIGDVWTRYTLAIPASIIAAIGLINQQRQFRREGLGSFGTDCLWAAIAFIWYGMVGQIFTRPSSLPPSNVINSVLFFDIFGFPVQLLRALAAIMAALFIIRFLRSIEYQIRLKINTLQEAQIQESRQRDEMRGEMLKRIVAAQEAERQRVARELHDATGQSLTAIGLGLRSISSAMKTDHSKAESNIIRLETLVDDALNELQRLISDLRPSHLDDLGLTATLRWYTNEINRRIPIEVSLDVNECPDDLPMEIKTAIFRIVQEAITNVIKHANASHAVVLVTCNKGMVTVNVIDNGDGFDSSKIFNPNRPSWGLIGMKERASLLNGEFIIKTEPGSGTSVEIKIPYIFKEMS